MQPYLRQVVNLKALKKIERGCGYSVYPNEKKNLQYFIDFSFFSFFVQWWTRNAVVWPQARYACRKYKSTAKLFHRAVGNSP